jgi:CMP-N-acetylneuraminic acid synthetase|tara:strand:+ start:88 stop:843 length:756 start_codon:yes stop_codon:yes gene_type:complete
MNLNSKNKVLFIIPARSGSKRIKNKNLKKLGNKYILELKIKSCLKTSLGEVLVSTNSKKISLLAKKFGAITPFLRTKKFSSSKSTMMSCILDTLSYIKLKKKIPKYICLVPLTYPFLKSKSILKAYNELIRQKKANSICSINEPINHPYEYILRDKKLTFNLLSYHGKKLSDFERTQDWPKSFVYSGALRITKTDYYNKFISKNNPAIKAETFDKNHCLGQLISAREAFDINVKKDLNTAKLMIKNKFFLK